ncbi:MAG: aldolase/citrate lyase family protein [Oscillospiraceae bacterium]|nr:aldolase/citrate lyase family protein [Oscillospiraceae bacterium]
MECNDILRKNLSNNEMLIGTHVSLSDSSVTEIFGEIGFDYVWIDMEHTALSKELVKQHLLAARASGTAGFVRIPYNDPILAKPILDIGADGIVFPSVCSREEAQKAINSCYYPPRGIRGFGPNRCAGYGLVEQADYCKLDGDQVFKVIQIEHISAVENLESIVSVNGIDAIVIGPQDLSASMGIIGEMEHPLLRKKIGSIVRTCKEAKVFVGVSCGSNESFINFMIDQGVNLISVDMDYSFILRGALEVKKMVETLKSNRSVL